MRPDDAAADFTGGSQVWQEATWVRAAKNSLWIGLWATVLATVLGTIAALGLSRPEMPYRRLIMAILISPMIVPVIIIATGMFFAYSAACVPEGSILGTVLSPILSHKGCLANSYVGVIMAHAMLGIPFVVITVTATLSGFDQSLIRASASLGASLVDNLLPGDHAAHPSRRHLRRAFCLRHFVRRSGRRALHRQPRPADHPAADVERHPRADQPGHPRCRHHPGHHLHRAARPL